MAAELKARIGLDSSRFERGLKRLRMRAAAFARASAADFQALGAATARLGMFAVGAGAGYAALARYVVGADDAIAKSARRSGLAVDEMSAMRMAAIRAGTSLSAVETAAQFTAVSMGNLQRGSATTVDAFDRLGLKLADVQGMGTGEAMRKIAGELVKVNDKAKQIEIAKAIFGRGGVQLLPMLGDLAEGLASARAEVTRLGVLVTPDQAARAERANDSIARLDDSIRGLARAAVSSDQVTRAVTVLTDAVVRLRESRAFAGFVASIQRGAESVVVSVVRLIDAWQMISPATRDAFATAGKILAGFGVAYAAGFVGPLLRITARLVGQMVALLSPQVLFGGLVAGLAFLAGLAIGRALERTFDLSGLVAKVVVTGQEIADVFWRVVSDVQTAFGALANLISAVLSNPSDYAAAWADFAEVMMSRAETQFGESMGRLKDQFAEIDAMADEDRGRGFLDNLSVETDKVIDEVKEKVTDLAGVVADKLGLGGLGDAFAEFGKAWEKTAGIKMPDLAKPVEKAAGFAADMADDLQRASNIRLRGIATFLPQARRRRGARAAGGGGGAAGAAVPVATGPAASPVAAGSAAGSQLGQLVQLARQRNAMLTRLVNTSLGAWS